MFMNRSDLLARWQRLTLPNKNITDPYQRQQSQLLASMMLVAIIITALSAPSLALVNPDSRWARTQMVIGIFEMLLAFMAYSLARMGKHQAATITFAVFGSIAVSIGALVIKGNDGLQFLYYLTLLVLFATMFLPTRLGIGIAILHGAEIVAYGLIDEATTMQAIINGPLLLNGLFAACVLLNVHYRNRFDRNLQAQLSESETRYRTVAGLATDFAFSLRVESDGTLTPEWLTDSYFDLTGYSPQNLDMEAQLKHYHPDDQAGVKEHQETVASGQACSDEFRLLAKDNTEYWIQMACEPIWDESGSRVERIFGAAKNITQRKHAEEEKLEMVLAQTRSDLMHGFFRQVAHDFRTSLTVIDTSRYMIQEYLKRGETKTVTENLDAIAYQVNRLNQQIENLRVLSRLNHPGTELCDLNAIAAATIEQHKPVMATKKLECAFFPCPDTPRIHAHPTELQRAIGLVLDNAIKYNTPGGKVTLRTTCAGEFIQVEVSDTGIGVEAKDQERIFEFFYRANNAIAHEPDGYGLGLSVARMVTEAYGGEIKVESNPGRGSTFTMRFLTLNQT